SGDLAGRAVAPSARRVATDAPRIGARYERLWRKELGVELRDSVLIQRYLFGHTGRVNKAMRAASKLPWLTSLLVDFTRGAVSYGALRRRLLTQFPRAALRLAGEKIRSGLSKKAEVRSQT